MRCQHFIVLVALLANNIYYCFEYCATQLKRENALIVLVVMRQFGKCLYVCLCIFWNH